ncbi:VOC family protein [Micromonospora echinofusca]|uniref:VOC family protein n=1 Tax=Micromonospora echinofusca TaxID=47858 RepID=A0ABS3VVI9_MICEH|nr:VOC family protein [Micromonospora echinofusca]MBO4208531.1 VOC family protein [Micromonospora echinofusca]
MATLTPRAVNHIATQTFDMEATHRFWTEVMGCRYAAGLRFPARTVSTGEAVPPFIHTFYELADGSCVAFFELAVSHERRDDGLPDWTRHYALSVSSRAELAEWKEHFEAHGVPVDGEIDHDGLFYSIYVKDPNGLRIELTYLTRTLGPDDHKEGLAELRSWVSDKAAGTLS